MSQEHEKSMNIINALLKILAEVPGTLLEHQQRINSLEYLRERLNELEGYNNNIIDSSEV